MEDVKIQEWLRDNGSGSGSGSGDGYGSGNGHNIKKINDDAVYIIDNVATIITAIKLALAKGFIVNRDFSLSPCYIVKGDGYFAHGKTVNKAREDPWEYGHRGGYREVSCYI